MVVMAKVAMMGLVVKLETEETLDLTRKMEFLAQKAIPAILVKTECQALKVPKGLLEVTAKKDQRVSQVRQAVMVPEETLAHREQWELMAAMAKRANLEFQVAMVIMAIKGTMVILVQLTIKKYVDLFTVQ